jgi:hypothetical protein
MTLLLSAALVTAATQPGFSQERLVPLGPTAPAGGYLRAIATEVNGTTYQDLALCDGAELHVALDPCYIDATLPLLNASGTAPEPVYDAAFTDGTNTIQRRLLFVGPSGLKRVTFQSDPLPITYQYESLLTGVWAGATRLTTGRLASSDAQFLAATKPSPGGDLLLIALSDGLDGFLPSPAVTLPGLTVRDLVTADLLGTGNELIVVLTDQFVLAIGWNGQFAGVSTSLVQGAPGGLTTVRHAGSLRESVAWVRDDAGPGSTLALLSVPVGWTTMHTELLSLGEEDYVRIASGDRVGDAGDDILLIDVDGDSVLLLENEGGSFSFTASTNVTVPSALGGASAAAIFDADEDGDGDLALASLETAEVLFAENTLGGGTWTLGGNSGADALTPQFTPDGGAVVPNVYLSEPAGNDLYMLHFDLPAPQIAPSGLDQIEVQLLRTVRSANDPTLWITDPVLLRRVLLDLSPSATGYSAAMMLDTQTPPSDVYYYVVMRFVATDANDLVTATGPPKLFWYMSNAAYTEDDPNDDDSMKFLASVEDDSTALLIECPVYLPTDSLPSTERPDSSGGLGRPGKVPNISLGGEGTGNSGGGSKPQ